MMYSKDLLAYMVRELHMKVKGKIGELEKLMLAHRKKHGYAAANELKHAYLEHLEHLKRMEKGKLYIGIRK